MNAAALRIIVIGFGLIGRRRARAIQDLPGVELAAIVDPYADAGSAPAGVPVYSSVAQASAAGYHAAVIAVPHDLAPGIATEVLELQRPVLIEKPLGVTPEQARQIADLAARLPTPSFVGYNYRFLPAVRELLRLTAAGGLGELRSIDMLVGHGGHPGSAEGWKLDPVRAGGGVLLDPGVHLLDLLTLIGPDLRCTDIQASSGFWKTGIEEDVVANFRAGELIASMRVSHVRWVNSFRIEVFGEDGYAIAEGRGGNYGPMTLRQGRRWAWTEEGVTGQRESEDVREFGTVDESLGEETRAVVAAWTAGVSTAAVPHPASMAEGRAVTELCQELYSRLGRR